LVEAVVLGHKCLLLLLRGQKDDLDGISQDVGHNKHRPYLELVALDHQGRDDLLPLILVRNLTRILNRVLVQARVLVQPLNIHGLLLLLVDHHSGDSNASSKTTLRAKPS
jgi:hypothetical protein